MDKKNMIDSWKMVSVGLVVAILIIVFIFTMNSITTSNYLSNIENSLNIMEQNISVIETKINNDSSVDNEDIVATVHQDSSDIEKEEIKEETLTAKYTRSMILSSLPSADYLSSYRLYKIAYISDDFEVLNAAENRLFTLILKMEGQELDGLYSCWWWDNRDHVYGISDYYGTSDMEWFLEAIRNRVNILYADLNPTDYNFGLRWLYWDINYFYVSGVSIEDLDNKLITLLPEMTNIKDIEAIFHLSGCYLSYTVRSLAVDRLNFLLEEVSDKDDFLIIWFMLTEYYDEGDPEKEYVDQKLIFLIPELSDQDIETISVWCHSGPLREALDEIMID